jgi:hypothetical protein
MEIEKSKRYRINVATSVKGVHTYDATVDFQGFTMEEVVAESEKLVKILDAKYPPQIG